MLLKERVSASIVEKRLKTGGCLAKATNMENPEDVLTDELVIKPDSDSGIDPELVQHTLETPKNVLTNDGKQRIWDKIRKDHPELPDTSKKD